MRNYCRFSKKIGKAEKIRYINIMSYQQWHQQAVKKAGPASSLTLYFNTLVFGLFMLAIFYFFTQFQGLGNPLNKAVADTSIVLIGLSMMLSGLCYFWDFVDTKIIYRKYLGLVGFGFALVHIWLSLPVFKRLLDLAYWTDLGNLRFTSAGAATVIFLLMALISNKYAAAELGGILWRKMLRVGYLAVVLIWLHVYLLKSSQWLDWYREGMQSLPTLSMLVAIFMTLVILLRVALWESLIRKKKASSVRR